MSIRLVVLTSSCRHSRLTRAFSVAIFAKEHANRRLYNKTNKQTKTSTQLLFETFRICVIIGNNESKHKCKCSYNSAVFAGNEPYCIECRCACALRNVVSFDVALIHTLFVCLGAIENAGEINLHTSLLVMLIV